MNCCHVAASVEYLAWLVSVDGCDHKRMGDYLEGEIARRIPAARTIWPSRVFFYVAEVPKEVQGYSVPYECGVCTHRGALVVVGARTMFWVWRLVVAAAGRFESWDDDGYRIRTAEGRAIDEIADLNAQVNTAVSVYLGAETLVGDNLNELVSELDSCPKHAKSIAVNFTIYAELWILLHEIVHTIPPKDAPAPSIEVVANDAVAAQNVHS
jgi:hypothetical protein